MNETVNMNAQQRLDALAENLTERFADKGCEVIIALGEATLVVPRDHLSAIALELRDDPVFSFEELIDVCGIDYSTYGQSEWATRSASSTGFGRGVDADQEAKDTGAERFAAVYHLLSLANNVRLRLRVYVDSEAPIVDTMVGIWASADWFEREAFDLYGILFSGHPDLRRILTDYGFVGHPFRKDFPLTGHVEMRYDPEAQRVVYEPVNIEPRTLVPRVIRDDHRFAAEEQQEQGASDA